MATKAAGTSESSTQTFYDYLHQKGVSDQEIGGSAAAATGAQAAPAKGGKPEGGDAFAYAFQNFSQHQAQVAEYFKSLGLDLSFLDDKGNISPEKFAELTQKLAGSGRGSLQKAGEGVQWPKPEDKLSSKDAHALQQKLVRSAFRQTELPLLSIDAQEKILQDFIAKQNLGPAGEKQLLKGLKRELNLANQGWDLQKKISHLATLKGREMGEGGAKLLHAAIEVDPQNVNAQRLLGAQLIKEGKPEEARAHFALAIQNTDDPHITRSILAMLDPEKFPGVLLRGETPESFFGDQFIASGRYGLAKKAYENGLKKTQDPAVQQWLEERIQWTEEKIQPHEMAFDSKDNSHATNLYLTLSQNGIPPGMMKKAGSGEDRKVTAPEIFAYASAHWGDPRVQAAVEQAHLNVAGLPKEWQDKIPTEGLAAVMGKYHLAWAAQLKKSGGDPEEQANHLRVAGNYLPDDTQVHIDTGEAYLAQGHTFEAVQEYLQASAIDSFLNGATNQKLIQTLNKAVPETVKAAKEKIAAGDPAGAKALLEPMIQAFKDVSSNALLFTDAEAVALGKQGGVGGGENLRLAAEASMELGKILDTENHHEDAVKHYQAAIEFAERTLSPELSKAKKEDAPALMIRSNAQLMLGEFSLAHAGAKKAAELDPQFKTRFDATVKTMEQKAEQFAKLREGFEKEKPPHAPSIQTYLTQELQIHEALGHADKVKELSLKLKDAMNAVALGPTRQAVNKLAADGLITAQGLEPFNDIAPKGPARFLDPSAPTKVSDYVTLEQSGGRTVLKFNEAFQKLNPGQQLMVMRGLHQAGMRANYARQAEKTQDPNQKLYFQTWVQRMDGNISAARLGLMKLKADTQSLTDPEGQALHQQVRQELRQSSFEGLQETKGQLEKLKEARELSETGEKKASRFSERMDYELDRLGQIEQLFQDGKIDTMEEGFALLDAPERALADTGVAKAGERFSLIPTQQGREDKEQEKKLSADLKAGTVSPGDLPAGGTAGPYGNIPRVKLAGGTVDVRSYPQGGPAAFAVVVGKEGGTVNLGGRMYFFHPSDAEQVVFFRPGYSEFTATNPPPSGEGVKLRRINSVGEAKVRPQDIRDPGLEGLLQTQTGLEKMKTPEGKNKFFQETARSFRMSGDYAIAAQLQRAVIAPEVDKAYAQLTPEQYQEMKRGIDGDKDIAEAVEKKLKEQKTGDPKGYQAQLDQFRETQFKATGAGEVPQGEALEQAFLAASIEAARGVHLGMALEKAAMKLVDQAHSEGKIADPTIAATWRDYDEMMDPTDKIGTISDQGRDEAAAFFLKEVAPGIAIGIATMGVGTALEVGMAGTRAIQAASALSKASKFGVGAGIFLGRNAAEALVQTGLESTLFGSQFTAKRWAYNFANQVAFHGVMRTWGATGGRLAEKAGERLAVAVEKGTVNQMQQVALGAGIKAGSVIGMKLTQYTVGTAGTYAEDFLFDTHHPGEFWDRWKDSAKHMVFNDIGMHGINVMTGNRASHAETLGRAKLGKSREVYSDLRSRGFDHKQAMRQAVDSAQALKIDGEGKLYTPGAEGEKVYEAPGEARQLDSAREAELNQRLLQVAEAEARALPAHVGEAGGEAGLVLRHPDAIGQVEGLKAAAGKRAEGIERETARPKPVVVIPDKHPAIDVALKFFGLEGQPFVADGKNLTPLMREKARATIDNSYRKRAGKQFDPGRPGPDQALRGEKFREATILRDLLLAKFGPEDHVSPQHLANVLNYLSGNGPRHLFEQVTGKAEAVDLKEAAEPAVAREPGEPRQLPPTPRERLEQAPIRNLMETFGLKSDEAFVAKVTEGIKVDPGKAREILHEVQQGFDNMHIQPHVHTAERVHQIKQQVFQAVLQGHLDLSSAQRLHSWMTQGRVDLAQMRRATGIDLSPEQITLRESQLGHPHSEWFAQYANNPESFNRKIHFIETTAGQINSRIMNCVLKGRMAERTEFKAAMIRDLEAQGIPISTDTGKAIDSMIDIVDTSYRAGLIDQPGGLSRHQMVDMLTTLYLHNSPNIRIGGAELTHVPMVVQATVDFRAAMPDMKHMSPAERVSALKKGFVTALYHDAGKWDPNLKTTEGFKLFAFKGKVKDGSGAEREVEVPEVMVAPGKTLKETLDQMQSDGALTADQVAAVQQNRAFMVPIIAHHESLNVRNTLGDLQKQGILTEAEAKEIWTGIERHALVSSWIIKNSQGGIGVHTKVFDDPQVQRFLHGFVGTPDTPGLMREIQAANITPEQLDLLLRSQDPTGKDLSMELRLLRKKITALREDFQTVFSEGDRAMMLGDHRGQVDPYKYVMAVMGRANADTTVHNLLLGADLSDNVAGVMKNHLIEMQLLDPAMATQIEGAFNSGMGWMQNLDPASAGLGKALTGDPKIQAMIADHAGVPAKEINADHIQAWLEACKAKTADGKMSPEMAAVHKAMEKPFYEFYALSDHKARFQFGAPEITLPPGPAANDNAQPSPTPPPGGIHGTPTVPPDVHEAPTQRVPTLEAEPATARHVDEATAGEKPSGIFASPTESDQISGIQERGTDIESLPPPDEAEARPSGIYDHPATVPEDLAPTLRPEEHTPGARTEGVQEYEDMLAGLRGTGDVFTRLATQGVDTVKEKGLRNNLRLGDIRWESRVEARVSLVKTFGDALTSLRTLGGEAGLILAEHLQQDLNLMQALEPPGTAEAKVMGGRLAVLLELHQSGGLENFLTHHGANAERELNFRGHLSKAGAGGLRPMSPTESVLEDFAKMGTWLKTHGGARGKAMADALQTDVDYMASRDVVFAHDVNAPTSEVGQRLGAARKAFLLAERLPPGSEGLGINTFDQVYPASLKSAPEVSGATVPPRGAIETIRPGAQGARHAVPEVLPPVTPLAEHEFIRQLSNAGRDVEYLLKMYPNDAELQAISRQITALDHETFALRKKKDVDLTAQTPQFLQLQQRVDARRGDFAMELVRGAEPAFSQLAPETWGEFRPWIEQAKAGEIQGHRLQGELTETCRAAMVEIARGQMKLPEDEMLPASLHAALAHVADGFVDAGLMAKGLKAETLNDFVAETVKMYQSIPKTEQSSLSGLDVLPISFSPHNFLGSKPTADSHLRMVIDNMRGYHRLFGDQAGLMFSRQGRLSAELRDPDGNPSGFHLVIERGDHEGHTGLRLAIYEGVPDPKHPLSSTSQLQLNFGPEGTLQVINLQGPHSLLVTTHPAAKGSLDRFGQVFEKGQAMDLLLASTVLLGRNAGFHKIEGIKAEAQQAYKDLKKMQERTVDPQQNVYDGTFARFGFRPPEPGGDYWSMDLGRLEIYRQTEPTRHRESPGVPRGERPYLPTVGPNQPADYFRQVLVRPNRVDTISDKRYKEWDRKHPRGTKDTKGNIKPGPVTEEVQNFWKGFAGALQHLEYQPGYTHREGDSLPEGNPLEVKTSAPREAPPAATPVVSEFNLPYALQEDYRALVDFQKGPALETELANQSQAVQEAYAKHEAAFGAGVIVVDRWAEYSKVMPLEQAQAMFPEKARYMIQARSSGAGTVEGRVATQADHEAYQLFQKHHAWPDEPFLAKDSPEILGLQALGGKFGVEIKIQHSLTPTQARYIEGILSSLPPELLNSPYLQGIHIGTQRVGAGKMSSFHNNIVNLYVGTLEGPRRNLVGLLLHEIGHSTGQRYALEEDRRLHGERAPDATIPRDVRVEMHWDHELVTGEMEGRTNQAFALDWMGGKEYRKGYVSSFDEFIAEFNVHYVANGDELRAHIRSIPDPMQREAYTRIYQEMRSRVFGGREYGELPVAKPAQPPIRGFESVPIEARRLAAEEIPAEVQARETAPMPRFSDSAAGEVSRLAGEAFRLGRSADPAMARKALTEQARPLVEGLARQVSPEVARSFWNFLKAGYRDAKATKLSQGELEAFARETSGLVRAAVESGTQGKGDFIDIYHQARDLITSKGFSPDEGTGKALLELVLISHREGVQRSIEASEAKRPLPSTLTEEASRILKLARSQEPADSSGNQMAAAARDFLAGKIDHDTYETRLENAAHQLVEDHFPAWHEVTTAIRDLAGFDRNGKPIPTRPGERKLPVTLEYSGMGGLGRMKDPHDVVAKLERRGWTALEPFTDFGGVRIIVKTGPGINPAREVANALGEIAKRFPIRLEYTAEGRIATDIRGKTGPQKTFRWDIQGESSLTVGKDSGYRKQHAVVEVAVTDVDGTVRHYPIEIQATTDAHFELARYEHKLGYKGPLKDHPALEKKVKAYCKAVSDYLAITTGLIPGELPAPPQLDAPTRQAIADALKAYPEKKGPFLENMGKVTGLLEKYGPKFEPVAVPARSLRSDEIPTEVRKKAETPLPRFPLEGEEVPISLTGDAIPISEPALPQAAFVPGRRDAGAEALDVARNRGGAQLDQDVPAELRFRTAGRGVDTSALKQSQVQVPDHQMVEFTALDGKVVKQTVGEIRTREGYLDQVLYGRNGPGPRMSEGLKAALKLRIERQPELTSLQAVQAEVAKVAQEVGSLKPLTRLLPKEVGKELLELMVRGERTPEQARQAAQDYRDLRTQTRTLPAVADAGARSELLHLMIKGERSPEQVRQVVQNYKDVLSIAKESGLEDGREIFDEKLMVDDDRFPKNPGKKLESVLGEMAPVMRNLAVQGKGNPEAMKYLTQWVLEGRTMTPEEAKWISGAVSKVPSGEGRMAAEALTRLHVVDKIPAERLEGVPSQSLQALVHHLDALGFESRAHLIRRIASGELDIHPTTKPEESSGVRHRAPLHIPPWLRRVSAVSKAGAILLGTKVANAMPEVLESGIHAIQQMGTAGQVGTALAAAVTGLAVSIGIPRVRRARQGGVVEDAAPLSSVGTPPDFKPYTEKKGERLVISSTRGKAELFPRDPKVQRLMTETELFKLNVKATEEANRDLEDLPFAILIFPPKAGHRFLDSEGKAITFHITKNEASRMGFKFADDGQLIEGGVPRNEWLMEIIPEREGKSAGKPADAEQMAEAAFEPGPARWQDDFDF